jgi:hypothetical protein
MDGSCGVPLINLKVGHKVKEITFLVNSGATRSYLTVGPPGCPFFRTGPNFWVNGEEFSIPLFEHIQVKFHRVTWVSLLFVPEAETNLLGRNLMSELGIEIKVVKKSFKIFLKFDNHENCEPNPLRGLH